MNEATFRKLDEFHTASRKPESSKQFLIQGIPEFVLLKQLISIQEEILSAEIIT